MLTPQTKRLMRDNYGKDSPSLSQEIFLPSEITKLKKLFPLLDSKVFIFIFWPQYCSNLKMYSLTVTRNAAKPMTRSWETKLGSSKRSFTQKHLLITKIELRLSLVRVPTIRTPLAPLTSTKRGRGMSLKATLQVKLKVLQVSSTQIRISGRRHNRIRAMSHKTTISKYITMITPLTPKAAGVKGKSHKWLRSHWKRFTPKALCIN